VAGDHRDESGSRGYRVQVRSVQQDLQDPVGGRENVRLLNAAYRSVIEILSGEAEKPCV